MKPTFRHDSLRLSDIRLDGGTQSRTGLDAALVREYAALLEDGGVMDPVEVFYDGVAYWLVDGFHRVAAYGTKGRPVIGALIHDGSLDEALWYSYSVNAKHGKQRSREDMQAAIRNALGHKNAAGKSDRDIARHVGVDHKTVGAARSKMEATGEVPQSPARTGADGRTINTANIGGKRPAKPDPVETKPASRPLAPIAAPPEPDEDYSALDDAEPVVVRVEPEAFATPAETERDPAPFAIERHAANVATAIRQAHSLVSAALASVPDRDRAAVLALIDRPVHLLLDVVEQLAPASAPKGWRPTVINGGRQ